MAFTTQPDTTLIAHSNKVTPAYVSSIVLGASATAAPGFPVDNLKHEDPQRILKVTSAPSDDPILDFTFSASQTFDCCGIVNHNLVSQGYTGIAIAYSGSFTPVGTTRNFGAFNQDEDFLLRFDAQSSTQWRIVLDKSSGWQPFYLGMVFFGTLYECTRQPIDGGISSTSASDFVQFRSAGGAKHVVASGLRPNETGELLFEYVGATQAEALVGLIGRNNLSRVVAVVPADEGGTDFPAITSAHKFVRVMDVRKRHRATSPIKYDVTLQLEGIMS